MGADTVLTAMEEGIATITLDRPARLNAVDETTRLALAAAIEAAARNPEVRALILTGAGRSFCVGQDLSAEAELADCEDCVRRTYNPVISALTGIAKPVIAAVNGPAVGAGMGFALACDIVLLAEGSFLSCAFCKVGLVPDSGATYFLARTLGHHRAFEIAASGRRIAPEEAVALGLANRVVPADRLLDEAKALAAQLAAGSQKALTLTKRLLHEAQSGSLADALTAEALAQGVLGHMPEHLALRNAFLAKSRPWPRAGANSD